MSGKELDMTEQLNNKKLNSAKFNHILMIRKVYQDFTVFHRKYLDKKDMGCVCVCVCVHICIYIYIYIHNGILLFNHKKNGIRPFAATWMDLQSIILSELSQTEKEKYHKTSLICGI